MINILNKKYVVLNYIFYKYIKYNFAYKIKQGSNYYKCKYIIVYYPKKEKSKTYSNFEKTLK